MDNQRIIQRFNKVKSDRTTVQEMWDLIEEYVTPYRGRMFRDQRNEHTIEWRQRQVWDSTAIMAHQTLAASLHGAISSPATQWFTIRYRDPKLNKNKQAAKWLKDASEIVYFTLQDSNFNLEVNETYQDLAGFGTSFLVQEEQAGSPDEWDGMTFKSVPIKEGFFEEDDNGGAGWFYRFFQWTPLQMVTRFGEKNVPQEILEQYDEDKDEKHDVLFCIFPRKVGKIELGKKVAPKRRPFGYKYMLYSTGESLGKEGGYYEMPVHTPRWRKTSESMWGNSPAMIAMNDILTLNAWVELVTIAAEKQIDPPILAEEHALVTDVDMDARALTIVRNIQGLKPFETGANLTVSLEGIDRLRDSIRNYFFNDQLMFPPPQGTPMTATESNIRYEMIQRLLGPTLGRLRSDMLDKVIARTFNMLARAGELPNPPAALAESNPELEMVYTGPLARAQQVDQATNTVRWLQSVGEVAAVAPPEIAADMWAPVAGQDVTRNMGQYLNVDPEMMRDEAETEREAADNKGKVQSMQGSELAAAEGEAIQKQAEGAQAVQQLQTAP